MRSVAVKRSAPKCCVIVNINCRSDEDVEDVFFLDEGANVMAAVSDR